MMVSSRSILGFCTRSVRKREMIASRVADSSVSMESWESGTWNRSESNAANDLASWTHPSRSSTFGDLYYYIVSDYAMLNWCEGTMPCRCQSQVQTCEFASESCQKYQWLMVLIITVRKAKLVGFSQADIICAPPLLKGDSTDCDTVFLTWNVREVESPPIWTVFVCPKAYFEKVEISKCNIYLPMEHQVPILWLIPRGTFCLEGFSGKDWGLCFDPLVPCYPRWRWNIW